MLCLSDETGLEDVEIREKDEGGYWEEDVLLAWGHVLILRGMRGVGRNGVCWSIGKGKVRRRGMCWGKGSGKVRLSEMCWSIGELEWMIASLFI